MFPLPGRADRGTKGVSHLRTRSDPRRLLQALLDASIPLTREGELEPALLRLVEGAMQLTGAPFGAAALVGPDGDIATFLHRGLTPEQVALLPHPPRGRGLLGAVLRDRRALRLDRLQDHPASVGFPDHHVTMTAFLGVPLQHGTNLVGALYLTKPPEDPPFTIEDQEVLEVMGVMATIGIENARLFEAEAARATRTSLLRAISSRAHRSLELSEVLSEAARALERATTADRCFIALVSGDPGDGPSQVVARSDDPGRGLPRPLPEELPASSRAVTARRTIAIADLDDEGDPSLQPLRDAGVRAVLSVPLLWGGRVLGVCTLHSSSPRVWSDDDITLLQDAAHEIAAAVANASLYQEAIRAAEDLRRLDRMRSDFVSMVTHELRTPLTVIAGIADILKRSDDIDADQRDQLLDTLQREARRLTRLVGSTLDLEAHDQGRFALMTSEVELAELIDEAVTDSGLAARVTVSGRTERRLRVDRDRIKQVLLNLLGNAAAYGPPDEPIELEVQPADGEITVRVDDRGPGIPPELRDRLFHRFSRLPGDTRPGSGLGLYLSRLIVEAHGGRIWCEDRPGGGASFRFTLPAERAA